MNVDEITTEIQRHCARFLGEHGGRNMAALARRGHVITAVEDETPPGPGHLGGAARLEPGTEWPEVDGRPLSLLAVLDFDALAAWPGADPRLGLLNFFHVQPYLDYTQDDGVDPFRDRRAWRVLAARTETAVETPAPSTAFGFDRRAVRAEAVVTLPGHEEPILDSLDLGPGNEDVLASVAAYDIRTTWPASTDTGGHRAFGWPSPQQGVSTGADEVLLLELACDGHFQWGDGGSLNFLVPAADLPAADFRRVRVVYGE